MGIPTVEDRLLQRAVARILEAVFEADFWNARMDFGRDATLIERCVRYAGRS